MGVARTRVRPRNVAEERRPTASAVGRLAQTEDASRERSVDLRTIAQFTTSVSTPTIKRPVCANGTSLETGGDLPDAAETRHLLSGLPVDEGPIPQSAVSVPAPAGDRSVGKKSTGVEQSSVQLHGIRQSVHQHRRGVPGIVMTGPNLAAPAHHASAREQCTGEASAHAHFRRVDDSINDGWPRDSRTGALAAEFAMLVAPPASDVSRFRDGTALVCTHRHINSRGKVGNYPGPQTKVERAVPELTRAILTPTGDSPVSQDNTSVPNRNRNGLRIGKPFNALGGSHDGGWSCNGTQGFAPATNVATRKQCANRPASCCEAYGVRQSDDSTRLESWHECSPVAQGSAVTPAARSTVRVQRTGVESTGSDADDIANGRAAAGVWRQLEFGASAAAERARNPHHDAHGSKHDVVQGSRLCQAAHPTPQRIAAKNGEPR